MASDDLAQCFDDRPVELDRHHTPAELSQRDGERAYARADLEDLIVGSDAGCLRHVVA